MLSVLGYCLGKCDLGVQTVCHLLISGYSGLGLRDSGMLRGLPLSGSQALPLSSPHPLGNLSLEPMSPSLGAWSPAQLNSVHQEF